SFHVPRFRISTKNNNPSQTETPIKHWGGSLNRCLSPKKLKNMQLQSGSIYIAKVGPFLIGGSTGGVFTDGGKGLGYSEAKMAR
ncbi:MAG: hypothetical protein QME90_19965, partial [Thermodesulfobacteriota bacterium]|nr:hypothetical protein [Thermodesulfobacteriota bacterium]